MARIKGKDLYLKNDDQIYFGNNHEAALWFDNDELQLNHTISGVEPIGPSHLTTKYYVDALVATISGSMNSFTGLSDVPTTYSGQSGKSLVVNDTEDGLIFAYPYINIDGGAASTVYSTADIIDGGNASSF